MIKLKKSQKFAETYSERLRDDLFNFFATVAVEIQVENIKIQEQAMAIKPQSAAVVAVTEAASSRLWTALLITLGVILLLCVLIVFPVICCLKKRGAFSSEHVHDDDVELPDEGDDEQRSPRRPAAVSPARAFSPARHPSASPVAKITFLGLELSILIGISFVAIISCCLAISVYSVNMIVQDILLDKKKQKLVEKYKDLEKEKEKKLEEEEEKKQEELEKKAEEKRRKDEEDRLKRRGMLPV
ncbi:hypothetical protein CRE_20513 [Caenorhabditis remanei]|uniref:Uncharacterized protein n=1 Tax=Caenorhabditis remanei TaxID=31234 RepID=E3N894_CAERE|nr:hypothetical protein CRE_20513 [Caenorhabditis remanei]